MLAVILLATYNGERYLAEQLDSIFTQSYPHILLIALDDCSSDTTYQILLEYQRRYPEKIRLLGVNADNQGPQKTFSDLLEYVLQHEQTLALEDYCLAFCDQDDIWDRHKLSISIDYLQSLCADQPDCAILLHSDLVVVDQQGQTINSSLSAYQGIQPQRNHFAELIMHNTVTGCSALLTPALARTCTPIPDEAYMHDWWCALIASLSGGVYYLEQPLVYYRQHEANTLGARQFQRRSQRRILQELVQPENNRVLQRVARQARYILQHPQTYRLTLLEKTACRLVAYLIRYNSGIVRAVAMKILNYLSIYRIQRRLQNNP